MVFQYLLRVHDISEAHRLYAIRIISSSRAFSRWFSWTSSTSLIALCWKPISLNWVRRCRNSAAWNKNLQVTLSVQLGCCCLCWSRTSSPCSHSSETSPGPLLLVLRHNPTHTDDCWLPSILGSVEKKTNQNEMLNLDAVMCEGTCNTLCNFITQ